MGTQNGQTVAQAKEFFEMAVTKSLEAKPKEVDQIYCMNFLQKNFQDLAELSLKDSMEKARATIEEDFDKV